MTAVAALVPAQPDIEVGAFPIEDLERDPSYQREPNVLWIRTIAANWDELVALVNNVVVSVRSDGRCFVVDGWHKVQAARARGITQLYQVRYRGLSLDVESRLFVDLNRNRRLPKQWDLFRALLAANDGAAMTIESVTKRHGYYCAANNDTVNAIQAIGALFDVHRRGGEALLDATLAVVRTAWSDEDDAKEGAMLKALSRFIQVGQAQGKGVDIDRLTTRLSQVSTNDINKKARVLVSPGVGGSNSMIRATSLAIGIVYNKGLRSGAIDLHGLTDAPRQVDDDAA